VLLKSDVGEMKVTNVLYSPSIKQNLLSMGSLANTGKVIVFTNTNVYMLDNLVRRNILARGHRDPNNGLYYFGDIVVENNQVNQLHEISTEDNNNSTNEEVK